jgi:hypothetical protein
MDVGDDPSDNKQPWLVVWIGPIGFLYRRDPRACGCLRGIPPERGSPG